MTKLLKHLNTILFFIAVLGCASGPGPQIATVAPPPATVVEITTKPSKSAGKVVVLNKKYYEVYYQPDFRLAKYVRYTLTAGQLREKNGDRKKAPTFGPDHQLAMMDMNPVTANEYPKASGYDKGHLAPAEDFRFSQEAMDSTFVLSNVVPQTGSLNRGAWKRLENLVRKWACGEEKITVFTGPILEPNLKKLKTGLPVPEEFFKVVVDETPPRKVVAYILKQGDKGDVLKQREVPIEQLQKRIHEELVFGADEMTRTPSQANPWKEKDCR